MEDMNGIEKDFHGIQLDLLKNIHGLQHSWDMHLDVGGDDVTAVTGIQ